MIKQMLFIFILKKLKKNHICINYEPTLGTYCIVNNLILIVVGMILLQIQDMTSCPDDNISHYPFQNNSKKTTRVPDYTNRFRCLVITPVELKPVYRWFHLN